MNRILNRAILIGFAVYLMLSGVPVFAQSCRTYYGEENKLGVTNEDNIYAVHITKFLPEDGFLRIVSKGRPRFLPTIHFSLGEPVMDHFAGKWSEKPFAVVTPMKSLRNQMLNLYPQDTYILGDYKIPNDAVLFVPKGTSVPGNLSFKVIEYDSEQGGVKGAVSRFLNSSNTIQFNTVSDKFFMKTFLGKLNIEQNGNIDKFFSRLINEKPHLTRGLHADTIWGDIDDIVIARLFDWVSGSKKYSEKKYRERNLDLDIETLSDRFVEITKLAQKLNLSGEAKRSFEESLIELRSFKYLLEAEKYAASLGKSVLGLDPKENPELHSLILSARYDKEKLINSVYENRNNLAEALVEGLSFVPINYYGLLKYKSPKEFADYLNEKFKNADLQTKNQIHQAIVKRVFARLRTGGMRAEDALPFFMEYKDALTRGSVMLEIGNDLYAVSGYKNGFTKLTYPHREFVRFLKYKKVHDALTALQAFENFSAEQMQTYNEAREAIKDLKDE